MHQKKQARQFGEQRIAYLKVGKRIGWKYLGLIIASLFFFTSTYNVLKGDPTSDDISDTKQMRKTPTSFNRTTKL